MHLPQFILLLSVHHWTSNAVLTFGDPSPALMNPHTVELEENDILELTCEISASHNQTHNASQVYFMKKQNYSLGHQYFQLVTSHIAKLHVPLASYEHWHGIIYCAVADIPVMFYHMRDMSALVVFRRDPLPPSIKSCVVQNWESLKCTWSPSLATQKEHTKGKHHPRYKFMWSYSSDHHAHYCCQDPGASSCEAPGAVNLTESCLMTRDSTVNPFDMGALYHLTVRAETDKAFVVNKWGNGTAYNTSLHVKPNPPENAAATFHNHTAQRISWQRPSTRWQQAYGWVLRYTVSVTSKHSQMTHVVESSDVQLSLLIPVVAYTTYNIWISAIPVHGGYQSDDAHLEFTIPATVPSTNPEVLPASYTYDACSPGSTCKVTVYWKPLTEDQLNGPDFSYVIKGKNVTSQTSLQNYDPNAWTVLKVVPNAIQSSAAINVRPTSSLEIIVQAQNSVGINPIVEEGRIRVHPKQALLPVHEHVVIEGVGDTSDVIFWLDPAHPIDRSAEYTVFWKNVKSQAANPLGWTNLPPGDEVTVILPLPHYQYQFGFMKNVNKQNSGITWIEGINNDDAIVLPPRDFEVRHTMMNSLTLAWKPPSYRRSAQIPYVRDYQLTFCVKNPRTNSCQEPVRNMTELVSGSETHTELLQLKANTEYVITIKSITRTKTSEAVTVQGLAKTLPGYSAMTIAGIVAGCLIGAVIFFIGIYTCCKKCWDCTVKPSKKIIIKMPDDTKLATRDSTSSEMPMLRSFSGSSFNSGYRRQISAVSSEISSDGEFCGGDHGDDPCFDNNNSHFLRYNSPAAKNLKCIPETCDDVFESDSDKEEGKFVQAYRLLPDQDKPSLSLKEEHWQQCNDPDPSEGGICKYAVIGLSQKTDNGDNFIVISGKPTSSIDPCNKNIEKENDALKEILINRQENSVQKPQNEKDINSPFIYSTKSSNYVPNNYPFPFSAMNPFTHTDCIKVPSVTDVRGQELMEEQAQ